MSLPAFGWSWLRSKHISKNWWVHGLHPRKTKQSNSTNQLLNKQINKSKASTRWAPTSYKSSHNSIYNDRRWPTLCGPEVKPQASYWTLNLLAALVRQYLGNRKRSKQMKTQEFFLFEKVMHKQLYMNKLPKSNLNIILIFLICITVYIYICKLPCHI